MKAPPARPKKKAMPARGRPAEGSGPSTRSQAPGCEPAVKRMPERPGRVVIQVKKEAWHSAGQACAQELACKAERGPGILQCQAP